MADPKVTLATTGNAAELAARARTERDGSGGETPVVPSSDRYVPFDPAVHEFKPGISGPTPYPHPDGPPEATPYTLMPTALPTSELVYDAESGTVGLAPWMQLVDSTKVYTMTAEEKTAWERTLLSAGSQVKPNTSPISGALNQLAQMGGSIVGGLGNIRLALPLLEKLPVLGGHAGTSSLSVAASAAGPMALIGGVWGAKQALQLTTDALDFRKQIQSVKEDYEHRIERFKAMHPGEPVPEELLHPTVAMPARQPNGMNMLQRDNEGSLQTVHQQVPLDVARKINRNQFIMATLTGARTGLMIAAGLTLNPVLAAASLGIGLGTMVYTLGPMTKQMVGQMKSAGVDRGQLLEMLKLLPKIPSALIKGIVHGIKTMGTKKEKPPIDVTVDKPHSIDPSALKPVMLQIPAGRQVINPNLQYEKGMDLLARDLQQALAVVFRSPRTFRGEDGPKNLQTLLAQHPGADLVYRFAHNSGRNVDPANTKKFLDTMTEMGGKVPGIPTPILMALAQKAQAQAQSQGNGSEPSARATDEQPT